MNLPDIRDFMRAHLYSAIATLRIGMNLLREKDRVISKRLPPTSRIFTD